MSETEMDRLANASMDYYVNVHDWKKHEEAVDAQRLHNARLKEKFIADRVAAWEESKAGELEEVSWGWNPLYHICAKNPAVSERLPPMPWKHNETEARDVVKALGTRRTLPVGAGLEAKIIRVFLLVHNIRYRSVLCTCLFLFFPPEVLYSIQHNLKKKKKTVTGPSYFPRALV